MVGQRYYTPQPFELDANGVPMAGAQLWFYLTGSNDLFATYSDVNLTNANPNPVIADANGRFGSIFLQTSQAYKVELWTAATPDNPTGSQIWSEDPTGPAAGGTQTSIVGIVGEVRAFAGLAAAVPALWYLCYGQAVSRTTYAAAFAAMGTSWGVGDGSTTFNLPDLRGRGLWGVDNMGGTPAGRVTSGVGGISGVSLGATGGDQAVQLHAHTVTDTGHVHAVTDPGHVHPNTAPTITTAFGGTNSSHLDDFQGPVANTPSAVTNITVQNNTTGITIANFGTGGSQNMPPAGMVNFMIYLGA